ncbi:MAG: hypothetical protein IKX50_05700 [Spirochaetia bacterium]|nr:hypothetical protein [Spirochaetia bacterium]MBR5017205.1 hypothetical protein [Spirochaetia bacterium]
MKKAILLFICFFIVFNLYAATPLYNAFWLEEYKETQELINQGERLNITEPGEIILLKERINLLSVLKTVELDMILRGLHEYSSTIIDAGYGGITYIVALDNEGQYYFYDVIIEPSFSTRSYGKIRLYKGNQQLSKELFLKKLAEANSIESVVNDNYYTVYKIDSSYVLEIKDGVYSLLSNVYKKTNQNVIDIPALIRYLSTGETIK